MNLLIIDDEPLILESVYQQLQEMDLEIQEILKARSAQEARMCMREKQIDIFLCDIVMPVEDGITFAKHALQDSPNSKFIFLTAHSDYEYMKEAISMQSFDYILQPASAEELRAVIERAMVQISLEEKNRIILASRTILLDDETDILEEKAFRYLSGEKERADYLKQSIELRTGEIKEGAVFFPFYFRVIRSEQNWTEADRILLRMIYYNIMDELLEPLDARSILFLKRDFSGEAWVLFRFSSDQVPEISRMKEFLENMRILFQKLLATETAVFCGVFCNYTGISDAVEEIANEVRQCIHNISAVYVVKGKTEWNDAEALNQQLASWKALLNRNQIQEFKKSLFRYLDYHAKRNAVNRDFLIRLHQQIVEMVVGRMAVCNVDSAVIFDEKVSYRDFLYCFRDVDQFRKVTEYTLDQLAEVTGVNRGDPVLQAIRFIQANIDRDVSVSELSDMAGMSAEHFSRMFKKKTGYSPKKYIVKEKMEAAQNLLATTNLPVMVIAEHVGYTNYSNFTFTFRQFCNDSPSEYRLSTRSGS